MIKHAAFRDNSSLLKDIFLTEKSKYSKNYEMLMRLEKSLKKARKEIPK